MTYTPTMSAQYWYEYRNIFNAAFGSSKALDTLGGFQNAIDITGGNEAGASGEAGVSVWEKSLPVIEIFGPVIQGEGSVAGQLTHFLRLGGCTSRCTWCDTLYAVLPDLVKANATRLRAKDVLSKLMDLGASTGVKVVTLSGGDPCMHANLAPIVATLRALGWTILVETQGVIWQAWLEGCDMITLSPKPPSSFTDDLEGDKMAKKDRRSWEEFKTHMVNGGLRTWIGPTDVTNIYPWQRVTLKIVVFDDVDFDWAREELLLWYKGGRYLLSDGVGMYLQAGTRTENAVKPLGDERAGILENLVWLWDKLIRACQESTEVSEAKMWAKVKALPQMHSLVYGCKARRV